MTENTIPQLSVSYTDQSEIPENFRNLYTERDGAFYLDAVSAKEVQEQKLKVDEFRKTNIQLMKEKEAIEKAKEQSANEQIDNERKQAEASGDQVKLLKIEMEAKLKAMQEDLKQKDQLLAQKQEDEIFAQRAKNLPGVQQGAEDFVKDLLKRDFRVVKDNDGNLSGELIAKDELTSESEWLQRISKDKPFFFRQVSGSDVPDRNGARIANSDGKIDVSQFKQNDTRAIAGSG